jgi:hypothetical protein
MGVYFLLKGRYDEATGQFDKARAIDPDTMLLEKYAFEANMQISRAIK